jgi:hypothetical protein
MVLAIIGAALIVAAAGASVMHAVLVARARRPGVLLMVPGIAPVLVGAVLIGSALIGAGFLTVDSLNVYCFVVPGLVGLLFLFLRVPYLAFYVLDDQGIQRNMLGQRRTLAWPSVDWIYGEQSSTMTRTRNVRYVGRGTPLETRYIVEAGPRQRISIPLDIYGATQQANQVVQVIGQRATNALVGRNHAHVVRARRAANARSQLVMHHEKESGESAHL